MIVLVLNDFQLSTIQLIIFWLCQGLQMAAEDMVSKLTPWPKELDKTHRTSLRRIGQHLALKATSVGEQVPFIK